MPKKNNEDLLIRLDSKLDAVRDHIQDINGKMERVDQRLDGIDVTMVRQQTILDEHVKRTNLLEEKIKPFEVRETQVRLLLKIGAGLLAIGAGGFGVKELVMFIIGR